MGGRVTRVPHSSVPTARCSTNTSSPVTGGTTSTVRTPLSFTGNYSLSLCNTFYDIRPHWSRHVTCGQKSRSIQWPRWRQRYRLTSGSPCGPGFEPRFGQLWFLKKKMCRELSEVWVVGEARQETDRKYRIGRGWTQDVPPDTCPIPTL